MMDYFEFDDKRVEMTAKDMNPKIDIFRVSSKKQNGLDDLTAWLTNKVENKINK